MNELSKPSINTIPGGYEFAYLDGDAEGIVAQVRYLQQDRHHKVSAELGLVNITDEAEVTLAGIRVELNSLHQRKTLVKELPENDTPWKEIVDDICQRTLALFRKIDDAEEVWATEEVTPIKYLVYPILPMNMPTIIFGEGSSFKSLIALLVGVIIRLPYKDNLLNFIPPKKPTPSLYIDYEDSKEDFQRRLSMLCKGLNIGMVGLNYMKLHLPLGDCIASIEKTIKLTKAECLIIDSLAQACGGNINEAETAIKFFSALRYLDTTTLIIAHTSKDPLTRRKSVFGSVFFSNYARYIWECRSTQEVNADEAVIGLYHRKTNISRYLPDMGFKITYNEDRIHITPQNLEETKLSNKGTLGSEIYNLLLSDGTLTVKEIAESLERPEGTIRTTCNRMKDKILVQLDDKWGVKASV